MYGMKFVGFLKNQSNITEVVLYEKKLESALIKLAKVLDLSTSEVKKFNLVELLEVDEPEHVCNCNSE